MCDEDGDSLEVDTAGVDEVEACVLVELTTVLLCVELPGYDEDDNLLEDGEVESGFGDTYGDDRRAARCLYALAFRKKVRNDHVLCVQNIRNPPSPASSSSLPNMIVRGSKVPDTVSCQRATKVVNIP